jgi:hypothetical protein
VKLEMACNSYPSGNVGTLALAEVDSLAGVAEFAYYPRPFGGVGSMAEKSFHLRGKVAAWCCAAALCCAAACSITATGCKTSGWLESPSEADLPMEATSPYPTAVATFDAPPEAESDEESLPPILAADSLPRPMSPDTLERKVMDPPPSTTPPLAFVPPHLRHLQKLDPPAVTLPPTAAAAPAPTPEATSDAAAATTTQVASVAPPNVESASEPSSAPAPAAAEPQGAPASAAVAATPNSASQTPSVGAPPDTVQAAAITAADSAKAAPADASDREASIERVRAELISTLETEIRDRRTKNPADEELPRLEQQLRLLYLAANRLDDAALAVESLDPQQREAYKHLMFGLGVWLSPDEARRAPLRTAKVLRSLRDSTGELSAASKLELRKLAFCERVDYFGWYTEFPRNEFRPKEQVILYVEVDNFAAEKKGQGYETELQGSYQIFDERGQIVAERQLPLDREVCRNYRRDYFLAYPIYMPDGISPGRYRLELTIEDRKAEGKYQGRKLGEGLIEFSIRQ